MEHFTKHQYSEGKMGARGSGLGARGSGARAPSRKILVPPELNVRDSGFGIDPLDLGPGF